MEYKTSPAAITSITDRTIVGIFAIHGNIDSYQDISHPGSFSKTLAERGSRIKFLWGHDTLGGPPIAKITGLREIARDELPDQVLALAPAATGGVEVTREYLKNDRAERVFEAVATGANDEMSYAYDAIRMDFSEVDGVKVRNLREIRLWEVSDVTFGANPATQGAKLHMPLDVLLKHLEVITDELKAGARHSSADSKLINKLHDLTVDLGATTCKGIAGVDDTSDTDKSVPSRAEHRSLTLLQMRQRQLASALALFGDI